MKSSTSFRFSSLVFFIIIIAGYHDVDANECEYKISVKTADVSYAGTNSRIKLILASASGSKLEIPDLANWGINGPSYDYFERGNLDIFIGRAACINVCNIIVTSDESGSMSGWKVDYVEVATTGPLHSHVLFVVDQWLASGGSDPQYSLSSVSSNKCQGDQDQNHNQNQNQRGVPVGTSF